MINEKYYKAPRAGFKKSDIEKILKKVKDLAVQLMNGEEYYISPFMHDKGKLDPDYADDNSIFLTDQDGDDIEVKYSEISQLQESLNEAKMPGYNLGVDIKRNWDYEEIVGKAISKLPGIDTYTKSQQRGGKWAVRDFAFGMTIKQYGKKDNTSKLSSILSKIDPNIDVLTLRNNFKSGPSSRSKHEQDNDIWTYDVDKKKDYHQFKKGMSNKGEPDTKMSRDVVMDLLDMMAPYSTTQDQLANQEWTRLEDFLQAATDHMSKINFKRFSKNVKKKYPKIKESVTEGTKQQLDMFHDRLPQTPYVGLKILYTEGPYKKPQVWTVTKVGEGMFGEYFEYKTEKGKKDKELTAIYRLGLDNGKYSPIKESVTEGRIQIKRKYGERGTIKTITKAPLRNSILNQIGERVVTEDEIKNILLKVEEDSGKPYNKTKWFRNNLRYFDRIRTSEGWSYKLSKYGKRVYNSIQEREKQIITEMRKLPKFNNFVMENEIINIFEGKSEVQQAVKHIMSGAGWASTEYLEQYGGPSGLSSKDMSDLAVELAKRGLLFKEDDLSDNHVMDGDNPADDDIDSVSVSDAKKMKF